jgi:hypothetical protein
VSDLFEAAPPHQHFPPPATDAFVRSPTGESVSSLPSEAGAVARLASATRLQPIERPLHEIHAKPSEETEGKHEEEDSDPLHHSPSPAPSVPAIADTALLAARRQMCANTQALLSIHFPHVGG